MNRTWSVPAIFVALAAIFLRFPASAPSGEASNGSESTGSAAKKNAAGTAVAGKETEIEGPWLATRRFYQSLDEPEALTTRKANPRTPVCPVPLERRCVISDPRVPLDFRVTRDIQEWAATDPEQVADFFGIEGKDKDQITWLTAIVPDPLHTRLPLFTDSSIGAILTAAAALHWEIAGQWMPWYDTVNADEKDPEKRRSQREDIRMQEKQPGILIFRYLNENFYLDQKRPKFDSRSLVIFLVGETPTGGVNPDQFLNARAYMNAIGMPTSVLIEGPTFTGSLFSLSKLIDQDHNFRPGISYVVRSGTVTSTVHKKAFLSGRESFVSLFSATLDSTTQRAGFEATYAALGIKPSEAAILVEDETAYGAAASEPTPEDPSRRRILDFRVFRFPRDISHLRNVYREAQQSGMSQGKLPLPEVDFSLKDPQTGEDSVPTFSASHSPLSQDAVVNQIAAAIRRDRIRLVQLNATNVLDAIFLTELLKRQCQDTRVLLSMPDVLFVEAARTESLNGTLALSTYPLFYHGGDGNHTLLSDANSLGVYNSVILSLAQGDPAELIDYGIDKIARPPTWLLTLDRQGFLPVATLRNSDEGFDKGSPAVTFRFKQPEPPPIWTAITGVTCLLLVTLAGVTWWVSTNNRAKPCAAMSWRLPPGEVSKSDVWRIFYAASILCLLATAASLLLPPLSENTKRGDIVIVCAILPGLFILVMIVLSLMKDRSTHREWGIIAVLWSLGVVVTILAATSIFWHWWLPMHLDHQREFFHFRALELRLGSSPLWPVLATVLALILFCYCQKIRIYLAVRQAPDVYTPPDSMALSKHLQWAAGELKSCLSDPYRPWSEGHGRLLLCCLGLCCLAGIIADLTQKMSTFDGTGFNALLFACICAVGLTLLLTCWHALTLWTLLRHFLSALEPLPFIGAFVRPERAGDRRPIWVRWLNLQSLDVFYRTTVILHDASLRNNLGLDLQTIEPMLNIYRAGLRLLLDPVEKRDEILIAARDLRSLNEAIAAQIFMSTMNHWGNDQLLRSAAKPEKAAPPANDDLPLYTIQGDPEKGIDLMHSLLALHYTPYLLYVVRQIQNLMWYIPASFVLLTFSLTSYGLQAPQFIGRFLLLLFVLVFLVLWRCMSGMERDMILSRIAGTSEGELDRGFYLKFLGYGALPVLSLLASEFPSISNFLYSWVEPTVKAMH
jgi:hypothetical protein